ncbi:porin [Ferrimonas sediminicola]|uniref:Porin n=1 Tax=Ferrimonas sediminicola TaxID=2569538 RepID=A0A4U1BJG0_9GAMM|nr:porin [Ferrimonas sediminicola]TKB51322.1 porin [Ferrimonas sediminicola]
MLKRTPALSAAALLVAASFGAQAQMPTFYGDLNISVTDSDTGYTTQITNGDTGTVLENNSSNVGIKGTHDINGALKLVYKVELGINGWDQKDGGKDALSSRNTYFGLAGGFGEVVFGKNDTAFKNSEGGVDAFGNLNADIAMILPGQDRVGDGITYVLPKVDLLTGKLTYILEDDNADKTSDDGDNYALFLGYGDKGLKKANFYVGGGYVDGISGLTAWRLTGQVKIADLALGAIYQSSEATSDSSVESDGYIVSAKYPLGNFMLKAQYGYEDGALGTFGKKAQGVTAGTVEDVTNFTVGGDYTLSKSAYLYAHYANYEASVKGAADIDDDVMTLGLRYRF